MAGGSSIRNVPVQPVITPHDANPANGQPQQEPPSSNIPTSGKASLRSAPGDRLQGHRLHASYTRPRSPSHSSDPSHSSHLPHSSGPSAPSTTSSASSIAPPGHEPSPQKLDELSDILSGIEDHLDEADGKQPTGQPKPGKGGHSVESLTQQLNELNDRVKELDKERHDAFLKNQEVQNKLKELQAYHDDAQGQLLTTAAQSMVNGIHALCKIMLKAQEAALRLIS